MSALFMVGDIKQPRKRPVNKSLSKEERQNLGALYYHGSDTERAALVRKWGKGRVRRSLKEFASAEIDASFQALRMRDSI